MRSGTYDPAKVRDEGLCAGNRSTLLTERLAVGTLFLIEVTLRAQPHPACLAWREATLAWWCSACLILPATASTRTSWPLPPRPNELAHGGGRARIPLQVDLSKQCRAIVLALFPALPQGR